MPTVKILGGLQKNFKGICKNNVNSFRLAISKKEGRNLADNRAVFKLYPRKP